MYIVPRVLAPATVFVVSALAVRIARVLALRRAWFDMPNDRSSHKEPIPRVGSAAFMPIVLVAVGVCWWRNRPPGVVPIAFFFGMAALFAVGLFDDIRSQSRTVRIAMHFLAAAGILVAIWFVWPSLATGDPHFLTRIVSPPSVGFWLLTVWIVGVLNIYNFMDGIDGIAGLQAVIAGVAWAFIAGAAGAPQLSLLAACVAAGALGFLTLNWPPAKIFMGDAGSTVLGYIFAALPLLVVVEADELPRVGWYLAAAFLVIWPFLADGAFTILRRLKNGENILVAHRSHLYQRLVISGVSHLVVTCVYGALAVFGAILAWLIVKRVPYSRIGALVGVAIAFAVLWTWVVMREARTALKAPSCADQPTPP